MFIVFYFQSCSEPEFDTWLKMTAKSNDKQIIHDQNEYHELDQYV